MRPLELQTTCALIRTIRTIDNIHSIDKLNLKFVHMNTVTRHTSLAIIKFSAPAYALDIYCI